MKRSEFRQLPLRDRAYAVFALCSLGLVVPSLTEAQHNDPDPERFEQQISRFEAWDTKNSHPTKATLFVGSSSIVMWNSAERFPNLPLINRGFGGSHVSDVNHYVEQTVLKYSPSTVVFYAGDNDLGAGKSVTQVFEDYQEFVEAVLEELPESEIVFVAVKPSIRRWSLWPKMQELNEKVHSFSGLRANLHYADIATPMLGKDGTPMPELFVRDGLHMTSAGYDIWTDVLANLLQSIH
jgi:lysophospholipase L1-like esterase|tara:strand:+ start:71 stop:784 length:714 start_codon:yes stop_codon:yes gene_type:complete